VLALVAGWFVIRVEQTPVAMRPFTVVQLPERAGAWVGERTRFCQDERCGRGVPEREAAAGVCPTCGAPLGDISVAERAILPPDTLIEHRLYRNPAGETVAVSLVVSGAEQKSIHRPQQCLPAQGLVIERSRVYEVPAGRDRSLRLMGLDVRRAGGADRARDLSHFAYWFFDGERETPYHLERLYWTSWDRLGNRGVARWAYVSLFVPRVPDSEAHRARLARFVADFHGPLMRGGGL
jgi:hypothetical protein